MFRKQLVCLLLIFSLLTSFSFATVYDKEGVMNEIYLHASNFESSFTIDYKGELEPLGDLLKLIDTTLSYDDYISKGISRYGISYESVDNNATITVSLEHNTPPEGEKAVDQYVEETLKQLHLEGQSDYVRAKSIMIFLDNHFSYDEDLIIHDPYTMIVSQKGVCQAYALLFYKMAKGAGLQVRTQEGTVQNGAHLWNLVKINDTWFHVDPTNTHFNKNSDFFLKGNQYFLNKTFTWTTLVEPVVDGNEVPDKTFTSGNYSEANIKDYLKQNMKVYVEYQAAKEAREAHEVLIAQHEILMKALSTLLTNPSKEAFKELTSISNAMTDPNSTVETDVKNALINAHNANLILLRNTYKSYSDRIQLLKANATEQNKLNMIKIGKETITSLKASAYEDTSLNAYLPAINANNRTIADSLTRQYIANAEKTKNKTYKDKAIALAKEYNFKDLLAKASKLKVK
jgi:hypothetical protein